MTINAREWKWTELDIRNLKPYPGWNDEAPTTDDASGTRLSQVHAIIDNQAGLPTGTVLAGWELVTAAKAKGEEVIIGFVRHDLASATAGEIATEAEILNSHGRCLSRLTRARRLKHLIDVFEQVPRRFQPYDRTRIKDEIGALFGIKRRAVDRDLRVLDAPTAIQQAYDAKLIGHADTAAIGSLGRQERETIAARIAAGESVRDVVADFLSPKTGRHKKAKDGFKMFAKNLARGLVDLENRPQEIARWEIRPELRTLERCRDFLVALIAKAQQDDASLDDLAEKLAVLSTEEVET